MTDPGTSFVPDPPALPARPGGLAARFSITEVTELAALLGLTPPTSLGNLARAAEHAEPDTPSFRGGAQDTSGTGSQAGAGSNGGDPSPDTVRQRLFGRGVLRVDAEQQLLMDDDAVAILTTICTASLVITVSTGPAHAPLRRTVYSLPGGAVVETSRRLGGEQLLHYLSLPNESILPTLVQWTGLVSQPAPDPVPDPAVVDVVSANAVTVLHRPGALLTVAQIAWNDCGATGLWRVEHDDTRALHGPQSSGLAGLAATHGLPGPDEPVTLTPISADGVLALVLDALP